MERYSFSFLIGLFEKPRHIIFKKPQRTRKGYNYCKYNVRYEEVKDKDWLAVEKGVLRCCRYFLRAARMVIPKVWERCVEGGEVCVLRSVVDTFFVKIAWVHGGPT